MDNELVAFPAKKRGKKLLLGDDHKVQVYLKKSREGGGAVSARIIMAAARGIHSPNLWSTEEETTLQYIEHIITLRRCERMWATTKQHS